MVAQRIRVEFTKSETVRFISHLDVLRYWERVIRRAGLPLAYSQGFTPHPRITFAGPLPVGFTGAAEIMDFQLEERRDPATVEQALALQSSPDMRAVRTYEVPVGAPALQASVTWADYRVVLAGTDAAKATATLDAFLARDEFEWVETRKDKERRYNLRAGVAAASVDPLEGGASALRLRLAANQDFTVRPEQVLEALFDGAEAVSIERERLLLKDHSPARIAWRRRGQYLDERRP